MKLPLPHFEQRLTVEGRVIAICRRSHLRNNIWLPHQVPLLLHSNSGRSIRNWKIWQGSNYMGNFYSIIPDCNQHAILLLLQPVAWLSIIQFCSVWRYLLHQTIWSAEWQNAMLPAIARSWVFEVGVMARICMQKGSRRRPGFGHRGTLLAALPIDCMRHILTEHQRIAPIRGSGMYRDNIHHPSSPLLTQAPKVFPLRLAVLELSGGPIVC